MNDKNIKEINKATDLISSLIHEYLYKKEYLKTLDIFQQELSEKIKSEKFYSFLNNNTNSYNTSSLINYFETGNKLKFMEQWNRIIPNNLKLTEPTLFKLDFNIAIYFAIYPILKNNSNFNDSLTKKNLEKNMEEFKIYLNQNKTEQIKSPEFLLYCALPYVPDPRKNPSYNNLFRPEWIKCLKEQIQRCIDYYSPSSFNKLPILYDLIRGKKIITIDNNINTGINNLKNINNLKKINKIDKNEENKIRELLEKNRIINVENNKLKINNDKNKKMYIDAQKTWCSLALDIISCSFDLLDIYNKITNNQRDSTIDEINNKLLKYQNFLVKNFDELENTNSNNFNFNEINISEEKEKYLKQLDDLKNNYNNYNNYSSYNNDKQSQSSNMKLKNDYKNINIKNSNNLHYSDKKNNNNNMAIEENIEHIEIMNNYDNYFIDMKKITEALNHKIYIEDIKLSHIFQEARFRIYRKENPTLRELTLFQIFYYDLLGTLSNSSNIFKQLLSNKDLNVEVMKFVNGLANFNKGKNYLLSKNTIIEDLVKCMISEKNDTELRQNCLGALQKFTLRSEPQNKLIELNIIHYLVDIFIYQSDNLSDYSIEYGLALLMNLSLRKEGKEKFEALSEKIMKIYLKFINYDNAQILTCINGMLYSLLKKKKIREQAKVYGLEKKLNELKKFNAEHINKQIKYIIDELNAYSTDENSNDENNEDEYAEEDINEKDDLDSIFYEYPENKIYDEKYMEEHYKIISEFIIKEYEMNNIEKNKIIKFMNENLNMIKGLLITNSNRSNDSSFRKEEKEERIKNNYSNDFNEEINNINEKNNINDYDEENMNINMNSNNDVKNSNSNDFDDIYGRPDDGFAFKTKDKLKRTPPRQTKYL